MAEIKIHLLKRDKFYKSQKTHKIAPQIYVTSCSSSTLEYSQNIYLLIKFIALRLTLNPDKTELISFASSSNLKNWQYISTNLHLEILEIVPSSTVTVRDLGVYLAGVVIGYACTY